MDNGLIFPYYQYLFDDGVTQEDKVSALLDMRVQALRLISRQIR